MSNAENTPTTPESTPTPKRRGFGLLYALGICGLLIAGGMEAYDKVNGVRKDVRGRQTAIVENRQNVVAILDKVVTELKSSGVVTKDFQKLEADNVKMNMDSQRTVALAAMTMFSTDLREIKAPTNGLMYLQNSASFSKELIETIKNGAKEVAALKVERNKLIKSLDDYDADLINGAIMKHFVDNKDFDLKAEKAWNILTGTVDRAKKGGVVDPINPLGKNAEIAD